MRFIFAALLLENVVANGCHDAAGNVITGLAPEEEAFCTTGALGEETPTINLWGPRDPHTRGPAPYPFPADRVCLTRPQHPVLHPPCTSKRWRSSLS